MSDTLADLSSWLPADFLSGDMDDKPLFPNHPLPYDFASTSSTESESEDDDLIPGLTRRFTRSVSLQERLKIPYPVEKRVFSGSPESTLNWNAFGPTNVRSSPTTPYCKPDEDAWDLIYAAAGQVARMKRNNVNNAGYGTRGLLGAPRPLGPPLSHHDRNCAMLRTEKELLIRQQQLRDRVSSVLNHGGLNYGGGGRFVAARPVVVGQSAWVPNPVETQCRQQPINEFGLKSVPVGSNGRGMTAVKKGCAGTGVFLPRNYSNNIPPEPKKYPVNSHVHPPANAQATINGGYSRQHQAPPLPQHHLKYDELAEMIRAHRQNAVMFAQQRRNSSSSTPEGQTEVVLPQEWTY